MPGVQTLVKFISERTKPLLSKDGTKTNQPATLTDLYPTLCELAGLPVPKQCTGISLVPQLKNPSAPRKRPSLTSFVFNRDKTSSHALSDDRYRYIKYADDFEELYDLKTDPHQMNNLASDPKHADTVTKLRARLMAELKETGDPRLIDDGKFFETPPMSGPVGGKKK